MKLTEEQKITVEENHSLIYWYLTMTGLEFSEWYDLLAIELCHTVMKYDKSKGSLSNYFKLRADGAVYKEYRKSLAQKRSHYETTEEFSDNVDDVFSVQHNTSPLDVAVFNEIFNGEHGEIIKLRYEGYSQTEIAKKLGMSQSKVSNILKGIKAKYEVNR